MMEKEMDTAPEVEIIEVEVEQRFQASGMDSQDGIW